MKRITSFGEVGMAVVVHGKEVGEFPHSDGNTYVWAKNGTEYSIVVWNFTDRRVEAVITVDGLDIINGKTGNYLTRGYVIDAHSKPQPIPGFKLNGDSAAKFTFGQPERSYANLMDKPDNIGVIGAAFFREKESLFEKFPGFRFRGDDGFSSQRSFGSPSLGTGFGKKTDFHTTSTSFYREDVNTPMAVLALHYHSKERLAEMGVDLKPQKLQIVGTPNPFPGNANGCTPPAGWRP